MPFEEISIPSIRMEEEEGIDPPRVRTPVGFERYVPPDAASTDTLPERSTVSQEAVRQLLEERRQILGDTRLSVRSKLRLLESNRLAMLLAQGGRIRKTENVVYGILVWGAVVLVTLALLTTYAKLPPEVTLSFVGTVLGGTIATIAQKLGKI